MPGKVTLESTAQRADGPSSLPYRIYTTDDHGTLSLSLPSEESRVLLKARATFDNGVHKMARGSLQGKIEVLALARHSGQIDIVSSTDGKHLLMMTMPNFKKGLHRWVGLAIATDGIFACSSAGDFTYTALDVLSGTQIISKDMTSIELPEPLQSVQFEPAIDPRMFAFGGETIPLSVRDVRKTIAATTAGSSDSSIESALEEVEKEELHGKARKRRRAMEKRIKGRELLPAEIWRAKSLPNTPIGLVNKPSISSIAFLEEDKVAVGTRHGVLQLYHIGPQRKPIREIDLFATEMIPVKLLSSSYAPGQLIAADNIGRVFVVDYTTSKILYKYEMFAASALSLCPLPPLGSSKAAHLVTCSAERLLRVHSMPETSVSKAKSKETGKVISTVFNSQGVRNILWDGVIPELSHDLIDPEDEAGRAAEEVVDENDDVWQEMAIVGDGEQEDEHRSQRRRI